ncbi:isochorismate synthase [Corynebacterium sphenisci]|uniref:isochorismate synthase n=1 Tax=Corynebacterium sphenisci TaxID=191493 RepID=UPI0026DEBA76|nr:isochorismate synthase [Corynebacterium sphenisci]MDO5731783.1 isochorismate synthase [Corynebacterium sphenisci]
MTAQRDAGSLDGPGRRFRDRPETAPDFLLSRSHGSVRTRGAVAGYADPWLAAEHLRRGRHRMLVGALPFNTDRPAALTVPREVVRSAQPLEPPAHYRARRGRLGARITAEDPAPAEHGERIAAAVRTIGASGLEKVVLARAIEIAFDAPIDPLLLAARLIDASPNRDGFVADLSPAGGRFAGRLLIGSSPEMLVRRRGTRVEAFPLAGSVARCRDRAEDEAAAARLLASRKNHDEHFFVVEDIAANLGPLCRDLEVPEDPVLLSTSEMHHLGTPIRGELRDPVISALDLALIVHPTPAICGTPTESAMGVIEAVEADRGFYAGAVGWCDSAGDGEFVVAIRCAEVDAGGTAARAWGGGGIVADSDPEEEVAETSAKLRTVLRAMGL